MGCDIHLALERKLVNKNKLFYNTAFNKETQKFDKIEGQKPYFSDDKWYPCPILGYVTHGERIYGMFANLAGVRAYGDKNYPEPKGFPEDACWPIFREFTDEVNDERAAYCREHDCSWWAITEKEAQERIDKWNEKVYEIPCGKDENGNPKICRYMRGCDWHSASWATREELETAFNNLFVKEYEGKQILIGEHMFYLGVLNLMKLFEENGDYEVRMVYWFDN